MYTSMAQASPADLATPAVAVLCGVLCVVLLLVLCVCGDKGKSQTEDIGLRDVTTDKPELRLSGEGQGHDVPQLNPDIDEPPSTRSSAALSGPG